MNPTDHTKAKIRVLKLERETLRELDAAELEQAHGGPGATRKGLECITAWPPGQCSRRC